MTLDEVKAIAKQAFDNPPQKPPPSQPTKSKCNQTTGPAKPRELTPAERTMRRPLPCVHLGKVRIPCNSMPIVGAIHKCKLKNIDCVRARVKPVYCCEDCNEYDDGGTTLDERRRALRDALLAPTPQLEGQGRGIVSCVGGVMYFRLAYMGFKALRATGCNLPVEWWHLGSHEFDDNMTRIAAENGIKVVNALNVVNLLKVKPRILNGWELKSFAMLHSGFAEALFLDADNYVTYNPECLFESHAYKRFGAIFWPDMPPQARKEWIPDVVWEMIGLEPRPTVRAFESGQLLVDRMRSQRALALTWHLNNWSDHYYKVVYGDKDTWLLGWHLAEQNYGMPNKPAGFQWPAIQQHTMDGQLLFQHVTNGKQSIILHQASRNQLIASPAMTAGLEDLKNRWHGRIWSYRDQTDEENQMARYFLGDWNYDLIGRGQRTLELKENGKMGRGKAACEQGWTIRKLNGRWTLIITGDGHKGTRIAMMFLQQDSDGAWRGRWCAHERTAVQMRHITSPLEGKNAIALPSFEPAEWHNAGAAVVTMTSSPYATGTHVLIQMLRLTGYTGPIQVWYRRNDPPKRALAGPGVSFHQLPDSERYHPIDQTAVLLNCGLGKVFWIDSDAYPVADITHVLEGVKGNAFWQDGPAGDMFNPRVYGLTDADAEQTFTPQCGVFVLDLNQSWQALQLNHWLTEPGRYEFYGSFGCGNEPNWRAAWRIAGQQQNRMHAEPVRLIEDGAALVHQNADGSPLVIHRTGAKFMPSKARRLDLPMDDQAWEFARQFDAEL